MSKTMNTIAGTKKTAMVNAVTTSALYDTLFDGRGFKGEYSQTKAYKRGNIVTVVENGVPTLKEAISDVEINLPYDAKYWTSPALGSPFYNSGTITLFNSEEYPFNNSDRIVTLTRPMEDDTYIVLTSCNDSGVEEVEIFDRKTNAFGIRYWGSTSTINITYVVLKAN